MPRFLPSRTCTHPRSRSFSAHLRWLAYTASLERLPCHTIPFPMLVSLSSLHRRQAQDRRTASTASARDQSCAVSTPRSTLNLGLAKRASRSHPRPS
eukprot:scaffold12020_cov122-Isochrysis_galbana.AAC.13